MTKLILDSIQVTFYEDPWYNFLEVYHNFLEFTTVFSNIHKNILCPLRSEVSYFGRRAHPILKTFRIFFPGDLKA